MSNILRETDAEISSFSGSNITSFEVGKPVYNKFFDNTSGKWERWSGSGAPFVRFIPSLEDSATNSVRVDIVAGDIELGTIGITGSIGLSVTGSNVIKNVGIDITGSIGKSITGSIGLSITGSSTLTVQGSVGVTGSTPLIVDARQSGSWNIAGGSVGITGSGILNTLVINTGSVPVKAQLTHATGIALPLDEDVGMLAIIDIDHYMIHSGSHFFVNDVSSGSVGVPKNWLFVSPATGEVHAYIQTSNAAAGTWRFWEDIPVSNSGSQGTAYNNNRQSEKTAGLKVYSNPVTGSGGTLIAVFYMGTITQGNAKPGGLAERNQEVILKTGSRYALQWEPDSGTVMCAINAQWYEVA